MNKKFLYFFGIIFLLLATFFVARKNKRNHVPQINLSALVLKDLDGGSINIDSFAGKPLVINFWATWCGPCREELPYFNKAKEKYGNRINFVMVSNETIDEIVRFKNQHSDTFLYAQTQIALSLLGITSVPTTYIYDANGKLIIKKRDSFSENDLNKIMVEMVDKKY